MSKMNLEHLGAGQQLLCFKQVIGQRAQNFGKSAKNGKSRDIGTGAKALFAKRKHLL